MALEYNEKDNEESWQEFLLILDDYTEWFHSLLQFIYYPEKYKSINLMKMPTSFKEILISANSKKEIEPEVYQKMRALYKELTDIADVLVRQIKKTKKKPNIDDFRNFLAIYEEFMLYIRRQEVDAIKTGSGYDSFTGLRNKAMLFPELERELQRLERQGKAFCVALVQINDFDKIKKNIETDDAKEQIKIVADIIQLSLRSFDDAYYTDECEFVLCLKQAGIAGGISALERLRIELEKKNITIIMNDGKKMLLSLSCRISEPVSGERAKDLIENLRKDLYETNPDYEEVDAVLQYVELSPLQRFIRDGATDS